MSFAYDFDQAAAAGGLNVNFDRQACLKRPTPFNLRLSAFERDRLTNEAAGAPLGSLYPRITASSGLTETEESEKRFRFSSVCASLAHAQWDIDHSRRC
jgi:hypothetical protein